METTRFCLHCGMPFRVSVNSGQQYDSAYCMEKGVLCEKRQARKKATTPNDTKPILNSKQKKSKEQRNPTVKTRKEEMPLSQNGPEKIKKHSTKKEEKITKSTETESEKRKTNGKGELILSTDSTPQSQNAEMVTCQSMNLLDDTARHLYGLMRGLTTNDPEPHIRHYDPQKVNSACLCAKNIYSIMRLKLDAIKLQTTLERNDGN